MGTSEAMAYFQEFTTRPIYRLGFGMMAFLSFLRIILSISFRIVNFEGKMGIRGWGSQWSPNSLFTNTRIV